MQLAWAKVEGNVFDLPFLCCILTAVSSFSASLSSHVTFLNLGILLAIKQIDRGEKTTLLEMRLVDILYTMGSSGSSASWSGGKSKYEVRTCP